MILLTLPNQPQHQAFIMKQTPHLTSFILAGVFALGSAWLTPALASDDHHAPSGARGWLSVRQVVDRLDAAGYRDVEKIERERGGYEVRATNRQGARVKLRVNPQTGDITDRSTSTLRSRNAKDARQRNNADCNERRCRDDLPPHPANPSDATRHQPAATPTL